MINIRVTRTNRFICALSLALTLFCAAGKAQSVTTTSSVSDAGTPPSIAPGNSSGDIEGYNAFTGTIAPTIPILHIGGRGEAQFNLVLPLPQRWRTSTSATATYQGGAATTYQYKFTPPWSSTAPTLSPGTVTGRYADYWQSCPAGSPIAVDVGATFTSFTYTRAAGDEVQLVSGLPSPVSDSCTNSPYKYSVDGDRETEFSWASGTTPIFFESDTDIQDSLTATTNPTFAANGYLVFGTGTMYRIDGSNISWARDRNGNQITFTYASGALSQVTDPLGRQVTINYADPSCNCITVNYKGFGGSARSVKIYTATLGASGSLRSGYSLQTYTQLFAEDTTDTGNYNPVVVTAVVYADGTEYKFQYDSYGELAEMTLPTGAIIQYDYASGISSSSDGFVTGNSGAISMIYRRLSQRREYSNGSTLSGTTSYTSSTTAGTAPAVGTTSATITKSGPNTTTTNVTSTFSGSPLDTLNLVAYRYGIVCSAWTEGLETNTAYGSLKTISRTYTLQGSSLGGNAPDTNGCYWLPPVLQKQTTTLNDTNQVSETDFQYNEDLQVSDKQVFDWGSGSKGSLLRDTQTTYMSDANGGENNYAYNFLLMLPSTVTVLDGGGNVLAKSQWNYDETQAASDSGIVGYNPVSIPDTGNSSITVRGNLTSEQHWLNTTNTWITTSTKTYDVAGNVLSVTDANNHTASAVFSDKFADGSSRGAYAFPTKVTNALSQSGSFTYDFYTGLKTLVTDANNQSVAYSYDNSDRPSQVTSSTTANTSSTTANTYFSYPTAQQKIIQIDQTASGDKALKVEMQLDGLGRTTEVDTYEGSSQYIARTASYDALGRQIATTNPSRPGDGLGYTASTSYDTLGRPYQLTAQDGTTSSVAYSGNTVRLTDQAGHSRQITKDVLGRITSVVEDPGNANWTTTYSYATPFQLTITQGTQQRTRVTDSLGRLIRSTDPESGLTSYGYDSVGNLISRTLANSKATTYHYDQANRLVQKLYSDGTPTVTFTYDNTQVANGVGRLSAVSTADQAGHAIALSIGSYDPVGRPLASTQTTSGVSYTFGYAYNLAGDLVTETYPSGRVVNTGFDGANRPVSVTGSNAGANKAYVSGITYWPHGSPSSLALGNGLQSSSQFNSRLQIISLAATLNGSQNQSLWGETYNWGTSNNNGKSLYGLTESSGDAVSANSTTQWTQTFTYDSVNRLATASDTGGWYRAFNYDQYGNMWVSENTATGVPLSPTTPEANVFTNNQISGSSYDAAGNQQAINGNNAAYDAENRLVSVSETPAFGGATATFAYDAVGRRVEKTLPSGTTVYVYDVAGKLAAEYTTSTQSSACSTCYLTRDHLGSVRLVTDNSGGVIGRHDYLPFGEEVPANTAGRNGSWGAQTDSVEPKFTGQTRDSETGLDYFGARYYNPALGRFVSPDPKAASLRLSNPQTFNRYAYALNNPLGFVDPDGREEAVDENGDGQTGSGYGAGYGDEGGAAAGGGDQIYNTGDTYTDEVTETSPSTIVTNIEAAANAFVNLPADWLSGIVQVVTAQTPGDLVSGGLKMGAGYLKALPIVAAPATGGASTLVGLFGDAGPTAAAITAEAATTVQTAEAVATSSSPVALLPAPTTVNPWVGDIQSTVTTSDTTMYRVWGGDSGQAGGWLTPTAPASSSEAISSLSLPPANTAQYLSEVLVPAGTRYQIGTAASAFGQPGGATQVLLLQDIPIINFSPGVPFP
jgi:RHS repeat-associated protein